MLGRVFWLLVGALIVIVGAGLYAPEQIARVIPVRYLDFGQAPLGPFSPYRPAVAMLAMAFGLTVIVAALRRRSGAPAMRRTRPVMLLGSDDAGPAAETLAEASAAKS